MYLDVFGKRIDVVFNSDLDSDGEYSSEKQLISCRDNMSVDQTNQTIIHELIHSVADRIGLENVELSHDLEEIIADCVAKVLVENVQEIKWKNITLKLNS